MPRAPVSESVVRARRRGGGDPLRRLVALAVALTLATPTAAAAAPEDDLARYYEEGLRAREAGDLTGAAERFAAAYALISAAELERRASVLFELVDAHRGAFAENGRPFHLCQADAVLSSFIADAEGGRGKSKSRDLRKANEIRVEVRAALERVRADRPSLDCASEPAVPSEPEPEPEPAPEPDSTTAGEPEPEPASTGRRFDDPVYFAGAVLTSAGSVCLGVVAVGLAVGRQAEFEGEWLVKTHPDVSTTTPQVVELDRMGRQANVAAIVGGVGGGVLLGVGIALLALGARRHRVSSLAQRPALSPRLLGAGLTWRF